MKEKCASFAKNIYFAESFDEPGGKGAFEVPRSFLFFFSLYTHLQIFARKFLVDLRTVYASPQNPARSLGTRSSIVRAFLLKWNGPHRNSKSYSYSRFGTCKNSFSCDPGELTAIHHNYANGLRWPFSFYFPQARLTFPALEAHRHFVPGALGDVTISGSPTAAVSNERFVRQTTNSGLWAIVWNKVLLDLVEFSGISSPTTFSIIDFASHTNHCFTVYQWCSAWVNDRNIRNLT